MRKESAEGGPAMVAVYVMPAISLHFGINTFSSPNPFLPLHNLFLLITPIIETSLLPRLHNFFLLFNPAIDMSSNMLSDDHIMRRVLATRQDPSSFSLSPQLFGLEHVQKKLDAAVERSEYHQQYFASWHPEQDQGILLYGPQDTGKTASVFHLAAKSKLPLFVVSHADILFPLQGDSEKYGQ